LGTTTKSTAGAIIGVICAGLLFDAQGSETSGACPFSSSAAGYWLTDDDGCAGADREPPQYPKMLERYGNKRPPFNVAGVDYHVGVSASVTLRDPATETLPAGCNYKASLVTCTKDNTIISGYDFSLHDGVQLYAAGVSGTIITNNKFGIGSTCKDPLIDIRNAGSVTIAHNTFEGAGSLCPDLLFGTFIFGVYSAGAVSTVEYNVFSNIPTDALQYAGPSSGAASIILRYNLYYIQGFFGHPDGIQTNGGNFEPIDVSFNTYYNASPPSTIGAQPLHLDAQLTAALNRSTVSYNTIVTPGHCDGGRAMGLVKAGTRLCVANFAISCGQDAGSNKNTNFSAYGNYIDSSGAITAFRDRACSGTSWGIPAPNRDLNTGLPIPGPHGR